MIDRGSQKKKAQIDVIISRTITAKVGKHAQNTAQASDVSNLSRSKNDVIAAGGAKDKTQMFTIVGSKKIGRRFGVTYTVKRFWVIAGLIV